MAKKLEKPIILITNDDDITTGYQALVESVKDLGKWWWLHPIARKAAWVTPSRSAHPSNE